MNRLTSNTSGGQVEVEGENVLRIFDPWYGHVPLVSTAMQGRTRSDGSLQDDVE